MIHVVGLGPDDARYLTDDARRHLTQFPARLRTRRHPAAVDFPALASYDEWYDRAEDFDSLYRDIVADVIAWHDAEATDVTYGVPGSPLVAEHTVELLLASGAPVRVHPAVSVIDVVVSALGVDPMAERVQILDALDMPTLEGSGPWLILQVYSPEIAALVADHLPAESQITVCWHAGGADEKISVCSVRELRGLDEADHLTSLWVRAPQQRSLADLIDLMHRLRHECAWDQDQTHESLQRHLLEEAYEVIDALSNYDDVSGAGAQHVEEELGDLLFQVLFHAELGTEVDAFSMSGIMNTIYAKLVSRHPHIFGDRELGTADEVAKQWEELKKVEKGRESVTDGVPLSLPGFALWSKMARKRRVAFDLQDSPETARAALVAAVQALRPLAHSVSDADIVTDEQCDAVVEALAAYALSAGVDLDAVARRLALELRGDIRRREGLSE